MRTLVRSGLLAVPFAIIAFAAAATADPGDDHGHDDIPVSPPSQPNFGSGMEGMKLLDVADKDGTINSDIAFYGRRAYVGNYDGFRIFDISKPKRLALLSDTKCRANQGDLSIFKARDGRMIMLQSIDRPVTAPDCSGVDTATVDEDQLGVTATRARFGFEGLRMFDVTNPRNPRFLRMYRNPCGSHTHTLVPSGSRVYAYVPSYPLGSHITPQVDRPESETLGLTCEAPHSKISIVSIPLSDPEAGNVYTQALSQDTEFYDPDGPYSPNGGANGGPSGTAPAFQACHDHQAFMPRKIMVAACAGDAQYWDISRAGNPTSGDGEPHTHIQREVRVDDPATPENERTESFEFMHNSTVTWDGQVAAITDESGGGVAARCDGDQTERGFTWFYPLVEPGTPVDGFGELGRFITPRPQNVELCVSHNGNVLPLSDGRDWQTQAFYQAGNSLVDFTDPAAPAERAFSDLETSVGLADSWSSYWYNDVLYVNGGLNRRGETANRGFEAYAVHGPSGKRIRTRDWKWLNPQTQETWQRPGAPNGKKG
jgi:hypothetical protein